MEDVPIPISLDEILEEEGAESSPSVGTELVAILEKDIKTKPHSERPPTEKVDNLIERMDNFMKCFASLHATVTSNQHTNQRKFKCLETAHNDLISKVVKSAESTENRIELLESKLEKSLSANAKLADKMAKLENDYDLRFNRQRRVNEQNAEKINDLEIEQGFTNRNMFDCRAEVKECKLIISGVDESNGENVKVTALNCINKVVEITLFLKEPDAHMAGLRKLKICDIDNVYRIGKQPRGSRRRNISVTFLTSDDKDMIVKAKASLKDEDSVNYFFNDDVSNDGRTLKSELKRIAQVAGSQGKIAKVSGNKVVIDSKSYFSNELKMIPAEVTAELKQEKEIEGGIVYKGERSIFSNFFPAPFVYDGVNYRHVEQYFQHSKALHHNEIESADRIMRLPNPRRIKTVWDSIEANTDWLQRRMMVLYNGVKAKFEQNWYLQDELISKKGKQLYEATTDPYFACGLGYDSARWSKHVWTGENVAGLIIMKVREELSGDQPITSDNTLREIASQDNLESSMNIDTYQKPLNNDTTGIDVSTSTITDANVSTSTAIDPPANQAQ